MTGQAMVVDELEIFSPRGARDVGCLEARRIRRGDHHPEGRNGCRATQRAEPRCACSKHRVRLRNFPPALRMEDAGDDRAPSRPRTLKRDARKFQCVRGGRQKKDGSVAIGRATVDAGGRLRASPFAGVSREGKNNGTLRQPLPAVQASSMHSSDAGTSPGSCAAGFISQHVPAVANGVALSRDMQSSLTPIEATPACGRAKPRTIQSTRQRQRMN